jgi:alkaline phosphatase D
LPGHPSAINAARRTRYLEHFGPDWWSFDVPGWRVLGLNAQLLGSDLPKPPSRTTPSPKRPASADAVSRCSCTSRCSTSSATRPRSPSASSIRRRADGCWQNSARDAGPHRLRPRPSVSRDRKPGARHVWGTSTAFVIPDRIQPRYGIKEVGYVEHTLEPDGSHDSRLVRVPAWRR